MLIVGVIWSLIPTFFKTLFWRILYPLNHWVNLENHVNKSKDFFPPFEQCTIHSCWFQSWVRWLGFLVRNEFGVSYKHSLEIRSDSDHSTKVSPTTLKLVFESVSLGKNASLPLFYRVFSTLAWIRQFIMRINPLPPSDAVRKQKKKILEDIFSPESPQFKKCHLSGNLKFINSGILQSLNCVI